MSDPTPTPTNLTEKFTALQLQLATQHADVLTELSGIRTRIQKVIDTLGDPSSTYPITYTVRELLGKLLEQFNTWAVTPTMKDLLATISQQTLLIAQNTADPLSVVPVDICAYPLKSVGSVYTDITVQFATPITIAIWENPIGGDFTSTYDASTGAYTTLHCTDWSLYRVYVASKAETFSFFTSVWTRYPTNQWATLDIPSGLVSGAVFNVDGANDLIVYICTAVEVPASGTLSLHSGTMVVPAGTGPAWSCVIPDWADYVSYDVITVPAVLNLYFTQNGVISGERPLNSEAIGYMATPGSGWMVYIGDNRIQSVEITAEIIACTGGIPA